VAAVEPLALQYPHARRYFEQFVYYHTGHARISDAVIEYLDTYERATPDPRDRAHEVAQFLERARMQTGELLGQPTSLGMLLERPLDWPDQFKPWCYYWFATFRSILVRPGDVERSIIPKGVTDGTNITYDLVIVPPNHQLKALTFHAEAKGRRLCGPLSSIVKSGQSASQHLVIGAQTGFFRTLDETPHLNICARRPIDVVCSVSRETEFTHWISRTCFPRLIASPSTRCVFRRQ